MLRNILAVVAGLDMSDPGQFSAYLANLTHP
jgi:hypothetical protein